MTEPIGDAGTETHPDSRGRKAGLVLRTVLLLVFFGLLFFSLTKVPYAQPAFHVGFAEHWRELIVVPACLTIVVGAAFVFANFSFGYLIGFYLFMMMAGYFWLNTFSVLTYDHRTALISAVASIVLFLLPCLMIRGPRWSYPLSHRHFDRIPEAILCFATGILIVCAWDGFHLAGLLGAEQYRTELAQTHPRAIEYAIGNVNGALIPFAFACFLARRRWMMLAAICAVSLLYYPVTLTKLSLFTAPLLIFMAIISSRFEARVSVILSLLVPLVIGLSAVTGSEWDDIELPRLVLFGALNFRPLAIPAISLEHYFAFFSDHAFTGFCQISALKAIIACPYGDQLGVVLANQYHLGNMNASLFATEGIASVGPRFAPIAALACGFVIALGNKVSAGLPPRFILISAAVISHILLDVPLSTTLLSKGLGLLMLLWYLTPRNWSRNDDRVADDK
jgi:hypothetical protein